MHLKIPEKREKKKKKVRRHSDTSSTFQAYLIGTVNTIQSIQCSKTTSNRLPNGTQTKKCKTHHLVGLTKEKEVLLCKADKVMVRLSIVKIDVFPF